MSEDLKALFPGGTPVDLEEHGWVSVFPLGVSHIKKFTGIVSIGLQMIPTEMVDEQKKEQLGARIAAQLIPFMLTEGLELIAECVKFEDQGKGLEQLPHYCLPVIIDTWFEESFGEEKKYRPWLHLTEKLVKRFTGKEITISEIVSKYFSESDTLEKTSSTETQETRTEAGA